MILEEKLEDNAFMNDLTKQERIIFMFLLAHRNNFANITSTFLAKELYCTTTSVNRLCKKMGVDGFLDLKSIVKYEVSKFKQEEYPIDITNYTYSKFIPNMQEVQEFCNGLDKELPIYIYGSGASAITAEYLDRKLTRLGFTSIVMLDKFLVLKVIPKQLIIISNSGETADSINIATLLSNDTTIFSLTTFNSVLHSYSHYCISHKYSLDNYSSINHDQQVHLITMVNFIDDQLRNL